MRFADQVAVITGASSGLGWALAKELAREGARVGLVARRAERLGQLAEEILAAGGRAAWAAADVACREQAVKAIIPLPANSAPPTSSLPTPASASPTPSTPSTAPMSKK